MTRRLAPLALLALLAGCGERKVDVGAAVPSVEDVCDAVCVMYDACWTVENDNPYASIAQCVDDCNFLYHAWPYDPDMRYECADVILELQWCYANLDGCEEYLQVSSQPGSPCAAEFGAYSSNGCIGGPDPRDSVPTTGNDE